MRTKAQLEEDLSREVDPLELSRLQNIDAAVRQQIEECGCGDETCTSCIVGVSIGIDSMDAAFNAGAKTMVKDMWKVMDAVKRPDGETVQMPIAYFLEEKHAVGFRALLNDDARYTLNGPEE